jgi:hypothetical protein
VADLFTDIFDDNDGQEEPARAFTPLDQDICELLLAATPIKHVDDSAGPTTTSPDTLGDVGFMEKCKTAKELYHSLFELFGFKDVEHVFKDADGIRLNSKIVHPRLFKINKQVRWWAKRADADEGKEGADYSRQRFQYWMSVRKTCKSKCVAFGITFKQKLAAMGEKVETA